MEAADVPASNAALMKEGVTACGGAGVLGDNEGCAKWHSEEREGALTVGTARKTRTGEREVGCGCARAAAVSAAGTRTRGRGGPAPGCPR